MTTNNVTIKRLTQSCDLMEAPHWDCKMKRLYFVDIYANKMYSYHTETKQIYSAYIKNGPISFIIPIQGKENKFVLGCARNLLEVTWDGQSNVADLPSEKLVSIEADRTDTRCNDGKVDSSGRLWFGTMGLEKEHGQRDPNRGSLYSVGSNLQPVTQYTPVTISNGIAWSLQDDTMYYIDSPTCQVWAFDFDAKNGEIKNKRIAFDFKKNNLESSPDGMTIDNNGNLWIASFLGSKVLNVDSRRGTLIRTIDMPVKNITSMAFGGPNLDILYVTTATHGLTEDEKKMQIDAGCLFAVEGLGVQGLLPNSFKM